MSNDSRSRAERKTGVRFSYAPLALRDSFRQMSLDATARRRWLGALALFLALAMLIAGETVLDGKLGVWAFLVYWLICSILTGAAVLVAFADARAVAQRTHQEHRELLERTLKEIETEAEARKRAKSG